ncbi:hypothetical protein [Pseudonocardia nantongensis]
MSGKNGRWQIHHDPYAISPIWVRNRHEQGLLQATWTHLRSGPVPFGELTWAHARESVAARGSDPVTESEIAAASARLFDTVEHGPEQPGLEAKRRSARTRRVVGRSRATATDRPLPAPDTSADPAAGSPETLEDAADGPEANSIHMTKSSTVIGTDRIRVPVAW